MDHNSTAYGVVTEFPLATTLLHGRFDPSATYLDATPDYIHIPSAPCRIAAAFPNAKLIVLLKDPAQV